VRHDIMLFKVINPPCQHNNPHKVHCDRPSPTELPELPRWPFVRTTCRHSDDNSELKPNLLFAVLRSPSLLVLPSLFAQGSTYPPWLAVYLLQDKYSRLLVSFSRFRRSWFCHHTPIHLVVYKGLLIAFFHFHA